MPTAPALRRSLLRCALATALAAAAPAAWAESLRCSGGIAAEGDSRLALLHKCGPPLLSDASCAPVVYAPTLNPVPEPYASAFVPCQLTEDWLYDRGPGNLMATVRLRGGSVLSIVYGREPR